MSDASGAERQNRILRNAGLLYFRLLITMAATLYTARVVLHSLGVNDFGVYHLLAGVVAAFGFAQGAVLAATQRFLSYELGRAGGGRAYSAFGMSLIIHAVAALVILLVAEVAGLWLLNFHVSIPSDRLFAANVVFHLLLAGFLVSVVSSPYVALAIAYERMNIFAWVSIFDVVLKLSIAFFLARVDSDRLVIYAALMLIINLSTAYLYWAYCRREFREVNVRVRWDKPLFKTMLAYAGWNVWGNAAAAASLHGVGVAISFFYSPATIAARAIAIQVMTALSGFVQSLQTAVNPQIIKSYAAGELGYMHRLVCYVSKYNFFLVLLISLPIVVQVDVILNVWLVVVPKYSSEFVQLGLIGILVESVSGPLMTAAQATGRIKLYQSVVGGILLFNFPISYVALSYGYPPTVTFGVSIVLSIFGLIARLLITSLLVGLPVRTYVQVVLPRILSVSMFSVIAAIGAVRSIGEGGEIFVAFLVFLSTGVCIYWLGIDASERGKLRGYGHNLYLRMIRRNAHRSW